MINETKEHETSFASRRLNQETELEENDRLAQELIRTIHVANRDMMDKLMVNSYFYESMNKQTFRRETSKTGWKRHSSAPKE